MKATCPRCGRRVGAHLPRGGDGTAVILRRHRTTASSPDDCHGSFRTVDREEDE